MDKTWFEENIDCLRLPIHIDSDADYMATLKQRYQEILSAFSGEELITLKSFTKHILDSIDAYYKNDTIESYEYIYELIYDLSKDPYANLCFSPFKDCAIPKNNDGNVQLFRAREGAPYAEYPAKEMGYVPFSQRSKCAANRYSLAGIPCLYLGNTSYVCWLEMNCPSDDKLCVSPYSIDDELFFCNIAIPCFRLYDSLKEDSDRQKFVYLMKMYLLEIATSFHVNQNGRQFHSEYIISQNIMRACVKLKFNGIVFYTTRASDNAMSLVCGINVAVFIDYSVENSTSRIFESKTEHGDSVNYAMYKNLLPCQNYVKFELAVDHSEYISNIGKMDKQIPYRETHFHEFDNYIFANWKKQERADS